MKVGILTFHNAINYGAVLQAYASQEVLKALGHSVEIIDYHNPKIDAYYNKFEFSLKKMITLNPKLLFKSFIVPILYYRRRLRYYDFLKSLRISTPVKECETISDYDAILIGSDQVWSVSHTGGFDNMYWGNFIVSPGTKKIAWSVCGGDVCMVNCRDVVSSYLRNFSKISVRELSLKKFLNSISDREVFVTLDPTLVADRRIWDTLCHSVKERDYILVYAVKYLSETLSIAKNIGRELKKKVIVIAAYSGRPFGFNVKQSCGPQDFLSYIKHASLVVTSSFHGTVFSILYEKEFLSVIPEGKSNMRVDNLLNILDLSDRIINKPESVRELPKINYNNVISLLDVNKERTIEFLHSSLNREN